VSLWRPYLLAGPSLSLLVLFLAGPLGLLLRVSLYEPAVGGRGFYQPGTWSVQSYRDLLADSTFREVAGFTVVAGAGITALTLLIAYPLALFIHRLPVRARAVAIGTVIVPKLCNVLVLVYGLQLVLSGAGPISQVIVWLGLSGEPVLLHRNLAGMVVGETYLLLGYAVLLVLVGLARVDGEVEAAARGLGAGPWQAFWRVTWPLSLPGLLAAGQLTLLWALAAVLGPLLLGGPQETTLGVEVQRQALEYHRWPRAAAIAVLLMGLLVAGLLLTGLRRREGSP
jgi:ABC-type spermidine/putrescine transport system permease subunit I